MNEAGFIHLTSPNPGAGGLFIRVTEIRLITPRGAGSDLWLLHDPEVGGCCAVAESPAQVMRRILD